MTYSLPWYLTFQQCQTQALPTNSKSTHTDTHQMHKHVYGKDTLAKVGMFQKGANEQKLGKEEASARREMILVWKMLDFRCP